MHPRIFQLVDESLLRQVLHAYVNGGHYICAVNGVEHGYVHILVQDLSAVHQAVSAAQLLVKGQFQSVLCTVLGTKHISNSTRGECGEGLAAGIIFFPVEAALVYALTEDGQLAHLAERVIIYTFRPYSPVAGTHSAVLLNLVLALKQMGLELRSRLLGEYLVQSVADAVDLLRPDGIPAVDASGVISTCLEIHKHLILRYTAGHQLSVTTQYIATAWLHAYAVTFQT